MGRLLPKRSIGFGAAVIVIASGLVVGGAVQRAAAASATVTASFTGWYTVAGEHHPSNQNYIVGDLETHRRDFFVFDLSSVTGTVTSATLQAVNPAGSYPAKTYTLYDVTTSIPTLEADQTTATSIYADLGSGTSYGSVFVSNPNASPIKVPLNSAGLAAVQAAEGGSLAIGGDWPGFGNIFEASQPPNGLVQLIINAGADLGVTKTAQSTVAPAGSIAYSIRVTNHGPLAATDATVSDPLPAHTTFESVTQNDGPTFTCTPLPVGGTGTVSCSIAALANGSSASFTLVVHVDPTAAAGTKIDNTASVSSTTPDPNSANDSSKAETTVVCDHTLTGAHAGSVTLSGGLWCVENASVGGALTVASGTTAMVVATTVGGALDAAKPGSVSLCGDTIKGSVNVSGAAGFVLVGDNGDDDCGANTLKGAVTLVSGTAGTELAHNHAYSSVTVNGNSGVGPFLPDDSQAEIEANTIDGSLTCSGNTPAPSHGTQPNTVTGARTGQCATPGF